MATSSTTTLHRYFIWANRFRSYFEKSLSEPLAADDLLWFAKPKGMYMSYWYAALYVVVEGWRELELHDAEVDRLLASPNVEYLRKYRNGVFHFQRDYFDLRFVELASSPDGVAWVHDLTAALSRWFLDQENRESKP